MEHHAGPSPSENHPRLPVCNKKLGFFHLRLLDGGTDRSRRIVVLRSDRLYTIGRNRRRCEIVLGGSCVSRRHCQIFLDGSDHRLRLLDGFFPSQSCDTEDIRQRFRSAVCLGSSPRVSLNGVIVNGRRLRRTIVAELKVGDEVLFGCGNGLGIGCRGAKYGFTVERILLSSEYRRFDTGDLLFPEAKLGFDDVVPRAELLLGQLRNILGCSDPVSYLRNSFHLVNGTKCANIDANAKEHQAASNVVSDAKECSNLDNSHTNDGCEETCSHGCKQNLVVSSGYINPRIHSAVGSEKISRHTCPNEDAAVDCYSDGKTFFLNRLKGIGPGAADQCTGVTLPQLLHPVGSLLRIFIATFTCDASWFLSSCKIPNRLPVTIACHSSERCWSANRESRTLIPYLSYPNLLLVYPPFPDVIAFGKDRNKQGVACHHPKFFFLQREDSVRVVITSANLVPKQWDHITNTVWWQDFPCRTAPDYSVLFGSIEDSKSDFAAQLAGIMASLITDVPSQADWIKELTKFDFAGAAGQLVASVPGIHAKSPSPLWANYVLSVKQILRLYSGSEKFLGSVEASVVGLSHLFRISSDSNGAQLKMLASLLGTCQENANGTIEVLLKRNTNISADANAVSVLVADLDEFSAGDSIQLGFLPKEVAKWVSPLSDLGLFNFSAFIYPKEALAAAFGGINTKVQLLLSVSEGPKFSEISRLIPEHLASLCSLLASIKRCLGLWRLQEVLSHYRWPESLETDFVYGSSSIGTSVNTQFLAAFSAAAGKRLSQYPDSEESDPEWGCWTADLESRTPSIRLLFPTIKRVISGANGIQLSRRLLSFSEKTWQRLRRADIFHDAVPNPCDRVGYPMHVKVGQRRFQSKVGSKSFGWVYCGSHNFSPAAWGQIVLPSSSSNMSRDAGSPALEPRLHICNYEVGIIIIVPPSDVAKEIGGKILDIDSITLPFVMPAPKYQQNDRPATAQAMREALADIALPQRDFSLAAVPLKEMNKDIPYEEEIFGTTDYFPEVNEEEKIYAEMLWSQVDSSEN
ncbi:uncharacterized protein [Typha latifolia]|uniref:uncharacterized protein n=1 Tax=Typha latifolia TaxID=4733 RepID=UPI003C2CBBA2